jgi:uncharacterized protein DUF6153
MTTPASRPRIPARPGLWVGSLFLVLAGLFGMHGLASDGPCDMPAMVGTAAAEMVLPHAGHGSMQGVPSSGAAPGMTTALSAATSVAARVLEGVVPGTAAGGGHGHGMVVLCVAVLAAALIVLLALLAARHARGYTVHGDRRRVRLRGPGRDRDPPSLTWLSILRY